MSKIASYMGSTGKWHVELDVFQDPSRTGLIGKLKGYTLISRSPDRDPMPVVETFGPEVLKGETEETILAASQKYLLDQYQANITFGKKSLNP